MFKQITRPAFALVLSAVIGFSTLGATATPARADNNDAARILGGIVALYAIGRIINEANQRNDGARQQAHVPQPPRQQGHQPQRTRQLVAPARCFVQGQDNNGRFRGYVRRCMQNNVAAPRLLPQNCLRRVWTQRGERMIYGGRCLANNGWVRG